MKLWKVILICFPISVALLGIMALIGMNISKSDHKKYTITYELDGGINDKANPSTYMKVSNDIVLANATKTGFDFLGWYTESLYDNKIETITKGSKGDITLYAKYEIINYSIVYELDGGTNSELNPTTYTVKDEVALNNPTKENFHFSGWYTTSTFEENSKLEKINVGTTGNLTLYAKFSADGYSISYELDGGKNSANNPLKHSRYYILLD